MDRREFLLGAASAAFVPLEISRASANVPTPRIAVRLAPPSAAWPVIPADFLGLSYESGQLYNPDFFSPRNQSLISVFRDLNPTGVLRLGGHLSNIAPWEGTGLDDPKQIRGVRHGIEDYWEWPLVDPTIQRNKHGILTRKALENLRAFLDAVNWRLIYGLNFACGSAARAADESSAVASIMGDRLIAFVVGNEADGFSEDPFFRDKNYGVPQYLAEYKAWVKTIRQRVPHANFAGPDTDGKVDTWVLEYARQTRGNAVLLTSHFYGMGPASDPSMTAERLLQKVNPDLEAQIAAVAEARRASGGTPYRMDEGNSCFGGGRKDVSDAYASALWAADYILKAACAGFCGVNFHGGGVGTYTPIETSVASPAQPRPVYYGMKFAQQFSGLRVAPCPLDTPANITAYQAARPIAPQPSMLALVNKGNASVQLTLPPTFASAAHLQRWNLTAPSLTAKTGVTFATAPHAHPSQATEIPPYSAAIFEVR